MHRRCCSTVRKPLRTQHFSSADSAAVQCVLDELLAECTVHRISVAEKVCARLKFARTAILSGCFCGYLLRRTRSESQAGSLLGRLLCFAVLFLPRTLQDLATSDETIWVCAEDGRRMVT